MNYLLLGITIILAAANNILLHRYSSRGETCNVFAFNAGVSVVWVIILLAAGRGVEPLSRHTMLFGILYGTMIALLLLFKMRAYGSGPVSITALIACSSLIVPTVCGKLLWNESVTAIQTVGLVLLFVSFYLVLNLKHDAKISRTYVLYALATFLCAGAGGVIMKMYARMGESAKKNDMMVVASVAAFVIFAAMYVFDRGRQAGKCSGASPASGKEISSSVTYILLCGITSCAYQRINLFLTGELPGTVFFPIFNGMVILLSCVAGIWAFQEKLSKKQAVGIVVGGVSIMLIGKLIAL